MPSKTSMYAYKLYVDKCDNASYMHACIERSSYIKLCKLSYKVAAAHA